MKFIGKDHEAERILLDQLDSDFDGSMGALEARMAKGQVTRTIARKAVNRAIAVALKDLAVMHREEPELVPEPARFRFVRRTVADHALRKLEEKHGKLSGPSRAAKKPRKESAGLTATEWSVLRKIAKMDKGQPGSKGGFYRVRSETEREAAESLSDKFLARETQPSHYMLSPGGRELASRRLYQTGRRKQKRARSAKSAKPGPRFMAIGGHVFKV